MTRLHTSAHIDVTSTLLGRIGRLTRVFTRAQPLDRAKDDVTTLNETRNQRTPQELLTYATDVVDQLTGAAQAPLHESFTQSWGELALAAHGRGEHEGRRYSLVCPACRAAQ